MWHATCTQGNQGDSWLSMVGSRTANLTPGPSFGHNLCFKYLNGSCKPILDICIPRPFQWYKQISQSNEFWLLQSPFEGSGVHWDSNSQSGSSLGSVGVHALTLSYTPRSMNCGSRVHIWPVPLQALALVLNPRLGLWQRVWYNSTTYNLTPLCISTTNHHF
jgi:hypothetical protein